MTVFLQVFWALGCIAWNIYGLWLIQEGRQPIGPTASLSAAALCLLFALLFGVFHAKRMWRPYVIVSALAGTMAFYAVYGGLTRDPMLWPSESWRMAGIALNGLGGLACVYAIVQSIRTYHQHKSI